MDLSLNSGHIWKRAFTKEDLDEVCKDSMVSHLGIEFTEIGNDYISARMPVDARTKQPFGLLHGGASVALAETIGSTAANCCLDEYHVCVGLEINANHVRKVVGGWVQGTAKPVYIGTRTQVWEMRISDENDHLVCTSRMTLAVLKKVAVS